MRVVKESVSWFSSLLTKLEYSGWNSVKLPYVKVLHYTPDGSQVAPYGQADGQTKRMN